MLLKKERFDFILRQVNLHNRVLSTDLSSLLGVSDDTVRRDLSELAEMGHIVKVHGGALSKSYHFPIHQSTTYAQKEKGIIGKKAVQLIKPGMVILTEAGTTMMEMVRQIPEDLEATFFTVSPLMALELAQYPGLTVILLGGQMDMTSQICLGEKPITELSQIRVDLCFLGANAIDAKNGLTETDWRVVQVKKAMIQSAQKLAVLTISEKMQSIHKMKVCPISRINYLITERKPSDKKLIAYSKHTQIL